MDTSAFDEAVPVMKGRDQFTRNWLSSFLDEKSIDTSNDDDDENIVSECNSLHLWTPVDTDEGIQGHERCPQYEKAEI